MKRVVRTKIKHKKVPARIYFFILTFFVAVTMIHCFSLYQTSKEYLLKQEEVLQQIQLEQAINDDLAKDLENASNGSDAFVEKEAREKFGLVMPNEIIFKNVGK